MSNMLKTVLGLAVILIVLVGLYFWFNDRGTTETVPADATSAQQSSDTLPSGSETTNVALTQDMKAIDAQMSGFAEDDANVDASLSDQEEEQSAL